MDRKLNTITDKPRHFKPYFVNKNLVQKKKSTHLIFREKITSFFFYQKVIFLIYNSINVAHT